MARSLKLLLTENVDSLGIVGDVVNVRVGYARNYLLPRSLATEPTEAALQAVADRRAEAQRQLAELRKEREALVGRLAGTELTIQRSCNDQGILYASVTQQDIAHALEQAGFPGVKPRDVRLSQNVKRVDTYDIHVKFEADLEADIKLWVVADRKLDLEKAAETPAAATDEAQAAEATEAAVAAPAVEKAPRAKGDKPEKAPREPKADKGAERSDKGEKKPKGDKAAKGDKAEKAADSGDKKAGGGWGTPVSKPDFDLGLRPRRSKR